MTKNIKHWYIKNYPSDKMGNNINNYCTFEGLFDILDSYKNVYDYLGNIDSVIRERVFIKLSQIMKVEYDYIYEQWLKCIK